MLSPSLTKWCRRGDCVSVTSDLRASWPLTFWLPLPDCSCHLHGALEAETDAAQLPLGPHRLRGGGGEWLWHCTPIPSVVSFCPTLVPLLPRDSQGSPGGSWCPGKAAPRLFFGIRVACGCQGDRLMSSGVLLISGLTWVHHPPVWSGTLATAHHTDLIVAGGGRAGLGGN